MRPLRIALIGDGESPHLYKWAKALAATPGVELWLASSRSISPEIGRLLPASRRLALGTSPDASGGNVALLAQLPHLGRWLREADADWLHAHYLTSHGTLAVLAKRWWRLRARVAGSAWGSDILVTPQRSVLHRWHASWVLAACAVTTSDSKHMATRMKELGAREVMTFPFGLDSLPVTPDTKEPWLFFANRALEPLYRPEEVLKFFAHIASMQPEAHLLIANEGRLLEALPRRAQELNLRVGKQGQVEFVGRLDEAAQAHCYARAQWYLSLPESDSVSVSVLEAMAYGCIPLLSDLPANRELVRDADNGAIVDDSRVDRAVLDALLARAGEVARMNRQWIRRHAMFGVAVARFVDRLRQISGE